jgi:chromosomal replication initiation ATPase DnaA
MTTPPRQLILDWPHQPSFAREDFLSAASNREALSAVDRWPHWPGRMLLLVGPEGSGKSHLAALWTHASGAATLHGDSLAAGSAPFSVETGALLIEDADRVGEAEENLFHLLNSALQANAWVLLTAREGPEAWGLKVPDLLSRLRLAPVARVGAPDRELTEAVLFKLFSDRQLQVEPRVITYIATRMERSLGAARRLVAMLDREALVKGRRVTRAMAGEMMREMTPHDESP